MPIAPKPPSGATRTPSGVEIPEDNVKAIRFLSKFLVDEYGGQHELAEEDVEAIFLRFENEIVGEGLSPVTVYSEVIAVLKERIRALSVATGGGK